MGNKETGVGKWDNYGMGFKPIRRIKNWDFLLAAIEDLVRQLLKS
jgi:pyruvate/2-oxoglutarate/acetoin dehydrogenase E1 component